MLCFIFQREVSIEKKFFKPENTKIFYNLQLLLTSLIFATFVT